MRTHRYQITISGGLGATAREAFADFRIEPNGINTALIGDLDQAALYGALNRVLSLGLELVALTRLNDDLGLSAQLAAGLPQADGGTCLISTSSRPCALTRSSTACRPRWSNSPDKTVVVGSTWTIVSANASRASGPNEPITLIS